MIEALDETIKNFLIQKTPLNQSEVDISFDVPNKEWSGSISKPTINIYFYDIRENLSFSPSHTDWDVERDPITGKMIKRRKGIRYDLSYLITCWTINVEDEHRLFWYILSTLARHDFIPTDMLEKPLDEQPYPLATKVAHPEGILRNVADVWTALDNQLKPVLPYVITVFLDPNISWEVQPVRSKFIRMSPPMENLRDQQGYLEEARHQNGNHPITVFNQVGGFVTDATDPGRPVQAEVILLEQGLNTRTDAAGRFTFSNLVERPKYTFIVVANGYVTRRHEVMAIPTASYDIALQPETAAVSS
jgi:hypothetical protein